MFENFPDQFAPFEVKEFGCTMKQYFPGTLFRFPLRKEQNVTSKISSRTWKERDIMELFFAFQKEAAQVPIFLNHVEKITLAVWKPNTSKPTPLFEVISKVENLESKRSFFQQMPKYSINSNSGPLTAQYMTTVTLSVPGIIPQVVLIFLVSQLLILLKTDHWLISAKVGSQEATALANDPLLKVRLNNETLT